MQTTPFSAFFFVVSAAAAALWSCSSADEGTSGQGGAAGSLGGMAGGSAGASSGAGNTSGSGATGGSAQGGTPPGGGSPAAGTGGGGAGGAPGTSGAASSANGGAGVAGSGGAGQGGGNAGSGGGGSTLPPVTDYSKPGPFMTTVEMKVGPSDGYTVYRPSTLGADGFKHPPIIFGPGIGQSVSVHTTLLTNFASHGFVVVGTPVLSGGPGDAGNLKLMRDGLDWILAQNAAAGPYQGKLDVKRAVSMGYSVGGTSAVQLGSHEAVATTVSIHGHTAMSAMHGPLLQTTGTKDTVGIPLQQRTYDMSPVQTFLATVTGADHGYIQNAGGGEERPAILAWMRYWINGDQGAKHYFYGEDCVMCQPPWENPQRKNWQ